jgi:hypothetical protein
MCENMSIYNFQTVFWALNPETLKRRGGKGSLGRKGVDWTEKKERGDEDGREWKGRDGKEREERERDQR